MMMTKKRRCYIILSWLFVAVCMGIIFFYSRERALDSQQTSNGLIALIERFFNYRFTSHFIRKTAHALEYFGLTLAFNLAYGTSFKKFSPLISLLSSVFYSATDEIHQFFVEGRACRASDLLVDFYGTLAMSVLLVAAYFVFKKILEKRGKKCQF